MSIVFKDFGTAYLAAPLAVGGLTITVDNPAALPILTNGDYFYLVLQKYGDRSYVEIVKVTATAGSTYTIQRGQAGTSIRVFAVGDYAELRLTVDGLTEYITQNIATKMDKSGGGDFSGLYRFLNPNTSRIDVVRTSDNVAASLVVDFSASEGHRTIVGGTTGANVATPSILLRPNGYGNGTGQVKIDSNGLVDVVGLNVRGQQGTDDGSVVRYGHLTNYVPTVRKVNGYSLTSDFSLSASDVKAVDKTGDVMSGSLIIDAAAPASESRVTTRRNNKHLYLFVGDASMGLYSVLGGTDELTNQALISRSLSNGSIVVGSALAPTVLNGKGNLKHGSYDVFTSGNKPVIDDVTGLATQLAELQAPRPINSIDWQGGVAFRNLLLNGDFRIWQRGVSHDWTGSAAKFAADRWNVNFSAAGSVFLTPEASRILGKASADISLVGKAAGAQFYMYQRLEDTMAWALRGKKATLSFIARASAPVTLGFTLHKPTSAYNDWTATTQLETTTFNVTTTAQRFSFTTDVLDGDKAAFGLQLMFNAVLGTGSLQITEIQFESGSFATPFECRPAGYELQLCKRYYQKYSSGIYAGSVAMWAPSAAGLAGALCVTPMRAVPMVFLSQGGVPNRVRNAGNNIPVDITGASFYAHDIKNGVISGIVAGGNVLAAGAMYDFDMVLDAEL